jgi:hypothetical protein
MHRDLRSDESDLTGHWLDTADRLVGDEVCARIEWLTRERLERVASDASGWDTLYRDPRDGRLWEHTYPDSHLHGGGPPRLTVLASELAAAKYRVSAS